MGNEEEAVQENGVADADAAAGAAEEAAAEVKRGEAWSKQLLFAVLICLYIGLNLIFNLFNKWLFNEAGGTGFKAPIFATWTSAIGMFIYALVLTLFPSIYVPADVRSMGGIPSVLAVAVFYAGGVCMTNGSLVFLPLHTQQVVRSSSPLAVAMVAFCIEGRRYSIGHLLSMICLASGVALTVANTLDATFIGLVLCVGSVLNTAFHYTFVSVNVSAKAMKGFDLLLYASLPAVAIMIPASIIAGELDEIKAFAEANGGWDIVGYMLLGSVLAVMYNLTIYAFIQHISGVYLSVVGVFKTILVVMVSIVVFHQEVNVQQAMGLTIALMSFGAVTYFEFKNKLKPKEDVEKQPLLQEEEEEDGELDAARSGMFEERDIEVDPEDPPVHK